MAGTLTSFTPQGSASPPDLVDPSRLAEWLESVVRTGQSRLEGAVLRRAFEAAWERDVDALDRLSRWAIAAREALEMKRQGERMTESLQSLWRALEPDLGDLAGVWDEACHLAIALGLLPAGMPPLPLAGYAQEATALVGDWGRWTLRMAVTSMHPAIAHANRELLR